jgi:Bacterial SH3 domain
MRASFARLVMWSLSLCVSPLYAQQAQVTHHVYLRSGPSTHNPAVETLRKGATVTLSDASPRRGFYHVRAVDGKVGWVGRKFITIESAAGTTGAPVQPTVGSALCDNSLWNHVYNPQRLIVKNKCIAVTGIMVDATNGKFPDGVRHEKDGDIHGWLKLDSQFHNLLNAGNISNEGGNLVFEVVCKFVPPTQADAKPACLAYKSSITIPPVGSHIRIVGTYVQDTNHAQWLEIHPVTSITRIP